MANFKDHKIGVDQLLYLLPEDLLIQLSQSTHVDHYTKVLHGKKMFYLLMYGILENDRLSQRTLEDTFNDPVFKMLFNLDELESIRRSSISERLSKIDSDYFRQIYEGIYKQFSGCYSWIEQEKYNLIRVDSSMVSDLSGRLIKGLKNNKGKKAIKYSVAFDGLLPCMAEAFNDISYASEDIALPEVVRSHVKQISDHRNVYVLDRGLQSTRNMKSFSDDSITFIVRAKENRKYVEIEPLLKNDTNTELGSLTLIYDGKVYLYSRTPSNESYKNALLEQPFRLIIGKPKSGQLKEFWFITNDFDLSAKEITEAYRRRWDIEVFFRFIKQELNVSHLVSLNKNGIEVMFYMTMIVAMLILIYKHYNNIGYKTAKRRFGIEIRDAVIAMIVVQCGGKPKLFFKT